MDRWLPDFLDRQTRQFIAGRSTKLRYNPPSGDSLRSGAAPAAEMAGTEFL